MFDEPRPGVSNPDLVSARMGRMQRVETVEVPDPRPRRRDLWVAVDALVDRAPSLDHLAWHGLHLLALRRWRAQERVVANPDLLEEERRAHLCALSAPVLLERVRSALQGPIVLMKGYEVALLYEDPSLRRFADLDLLVEDSSAAQRTLIAAGFIEVGDPDLFVDIHHQRPLWLPGFPLKIEVHHEPKWPEWIVRPPGVRELFESAVASSSGVEGISTLPPEQHAVLLAAHSWAHIPLRGVNELLDVAAVAESSERAEIATRAEAWGLGRVWRTTIGCVDSLFYGGRTTAAQRIWARHLADVRERTVLESHVQKWISGFWAMPWYKGLPLMASAVGAEFTPAEEETWRDKGGRVRRALRNAAVPRTLHDQQLGPGAHRRRRR